MNYMIAMSGGVDSSVSLSLMKKTSVREREYSA